MDKVHCYAPHDNSRRHNVAENRNHMAEAVELFVKRGFNAAIYLGSSEDFAISVLSPTANTLIMP